MPFSSTDASRIKNDMGFTGYGFGRPNREKPVCCTGFERAAYCSLLPREGENGALIRGI